VSFRFLSFFFRLLSLLFQLPHLHRCGGTLLSRGRCGVHVQCYTFVTVGATCSRGITSLSHGTEICPHMIQSYLTTHNARIIVTWYRNCDISTHHILGLLSPFYHEYTPSEHEHTPSERKSTPSERESTPSERETLKPPKP
jgi:hypothetical protein